MTQSAGWNPFDAAAEWAQKQTEQPAAPSAADPNAVPADLPKDPDHSSGSHLTPLGWSVLTVVLAGGMFALMWHATSLAMLRPTFARRAAR